MKLDFNFVKACKETEVELDGVILALGGRYFGPKTIVTYQNGDVVKYKIQGELGENSIPDKTNAVKVEIGTLVTSIGNNSFYDCSGLSSVAIPDSVTSIGNNAFRTCRGLTSIMIPDSVTSIGYSAFSGCSGLTSLTIPDSVTSIGGGNNAFHGCSGLTTIIVDSNNSIYDSRNNCNAIIRTSDNTLIAGCKNTIIPDSVTSIEEWAFRDCSGLTSVTIPDNVTSIGTSVFYGCTALSSITSLRNSAPIVQSNTFGNSNATYTGRNTYSSGDNVLTIPLGATGYNSNAWANQLLDSSKCGFHIDYIVPEDHDETVVRYNDKTVSSYNIIGEFKYNSVSNIYSIVKVEIGNTVTSINGFSDCSLLSSVTIPNSVSSTLSIKSFAFYMTMELKEITIPKTVISIEGSAFNKSAFETITFEDRTISEVQSMQNYSSWGLDDAPSALGTFQRTIVCSDGTFTVTAYNHGGPE